MSATTVRATTARVTWNGGSMRSCPFGSFEAAEAWASATIERIDGACVRVTGRTVIDVQVAPSAVVHATPGAARHAGLSGMRRPPAELIGGGAA